MERTYIDLRQLPDEMPWHFSQAVKAGNTVYVAGQVGAGEGSIAAQTKKAYQNVVDVLAKAGATMDDVVRETVYLADRSKLGEVAKVRLTFYGERFPASTAVFSGSGDGYDIEVEVTAVIDE